MKITEGRRRRVHKYTPEDGLASKGLVDQGMTVQQAPQPRGRTSTHHMSTRWWITTLIGQVPYARYDKTGLREAGRLYRENPPLGSAR